ncbi:MAG: type III-B CRISPR module-associated Cmr3 family protein [Stellaceae bacterium]
MTDLVLSPRDGLFLKDGREWATSQEGRAHSLLWPMPSTLFGALCTAQGRAKEAAGQNLAPQQWQALAATMTLGPSLALRRPLAEASPWSPAHRVWPVPADALFLADEAGRAQRVLRLDPRPSRHAMLGRDDDEVVARLWWPRMDEQTKPAGAPLWWEEQAFVTWLADPAAERPCKGPFPGLALPRHVQAHVGIDPATFAARASILFAHDVIEMLDEARCEWAIGCRVALAGNPPDLATLGGDRRVAKILSLPAGSDLFAFPPDLGKAFDQQQPKGVRLVAVTPAVFAAGWLPDGFEATGDNTCRGRLPEIDADLILRAARVLRPAHVSGWDMAAGKPKPTTRLVPPGTVYHLEADGGVFSAAIAESLWLAAFGCRTEQGFGRFVPGVWHPEENGT